MKAWFLVGLLAAFSLTVGADPQGVQGEATCHFPWSADNADDEYKRGNTQINLNEDDTATGTIVDMNCYAETKYLLKNNTYAAEGQPGISQPVHLKGSAAQWPGDDGTYLTLNTACSITNDDGTTYTTDDWNLEIFWLPEAPSSIYLVQHKQLSCRNGTQ